MNTLVTVVNDASKRADDIATGQDRFGQDRTLYSVLASVMSEVGELAEEVSIDEGYSYKAPGIDGVIGEAIDVIIAALDLIYLADTEITEERIVEIARNKCNKWLSNLK